MGPNEANRSPDSDSGYSILASRPVARDACRENVLLIGERGNVPMPTNQYKGT